MTDSQGIAALLGGAAAIVTAVAAYVAAAKPAKPKDDQSSDLPRRPFDSQPESIESRLSRVEERQAGHDRRLTSCESDVRGLQEDRDEMNDHIHAVKLGAVERQGEVNAKLAELLGARGGRRRGS